MGNVIKNKRLIVILSIIGVIFIVGIVGTYAWYVWSSNDEDRTDIVTSVGVASVVYDDGADVIGEEIIPVSDKTEGIIKNISVRTKNNTIGNVSFNLYLDINSIDEGLKHESFKYELWKGDQFVKGGDFSSESLTSNLVTCNKNGTSHIVLLNDVTVDSRLLSYSLYIWIDGANYENPYEMVNKNFSFTLHADGQNAYLGESEYTNGSFANVIVNKYSNSNNKVNVTNNGVSYQYDETNNLMSDIGGNVRYYGASPDNYVYFNCDDYEVPSSSTCELWRIIGVVDGKVKIVKNNKLGDYSWNINEIGEYHNNWNKASIKTLLNRYYDNENGYVHTNYNSSSGYVNFVTINFASSKKGIKDSTRNGSYIADSSWYTNEVNSGNYSNEIYTNERTGNSKWNGKIALMYPSDYGYASDLSICNVTLSNYNNANCTSNNWIYTMNRANSTNSAQFITASTNGIWRLGYNGNVVKDSDVRYTWNIYPTLYLESNVVTYGGNGSIDNPYRIYDKNISRGKIKSYITNLYINNNPTPITHKSEDGNDVADYYYAKSVNLMNDGLGATVNDTTALINGAEGNIRYYGKNPNNYIYFNCNDYSNQNSNTCERWRIIGIVDGKVKIIRDDSLGKFPWDYTKGDGSYETKTCPDGSVINTDMKAGPYDSNWHDSTIMNILNIGYFNNQNNVLSYYRQAYFANSCSGGVSFALEDAKRITNFNDDNLGIKNDKTRSMISESTWYLGGHDSAGIYPNQMYGYERGNQIGANSSKTWSGKIALMYLSDYGYGADLSMCNKMIFNYHKKSDVTNCNDKNWLFKDSSWLITPDSKYERSVYKVSGYLSSSIVYSDENIYPTLYLDSELRLKDVGDGSYNSPYQIDISN